MDTAIMNKTAWAYFSGEDGSKSLYFRDHPWPIYLLFSIIIVGAVFNLFLVGISAYLYIELLVVDLALLGYATTKGMYPNNIPTY